jgi:hypothetical protein
MAIKSINPITEVTLEKGNTRRLTKKFKYEKTVLDKEIKFHPHDMTISEF